MDCFEVIFVYLGFFLISGFVGLSEIIINCNVDGDFDYLVLLIDVGMDKWMVLECGVLGCGE